MEKIEYRHKKSEEKLFSSPLPSTTKKPPVGCWETKWLVVILGLPWYVIEKERHWKEEEHIGTFQRGVKEVIRTIRFGKSSYLFAIRSQDLRKERKAIREGLVQESVVKQEEEEEPFVIDEYKDMSGKGSFDTGDPLTTNLYVGNINPKVSCGWLVCSMYHMCLLQR